MSLSVDPDILDTKRIGVAVGIGRQAVAGTETVDCLFLPYLPILGIHRAVGSQQVGSSNKSLQIVSNSPTGGRSICLPDST